MQYSLLSLFALVATATATISPTWPIGDSVWPAYVEKTITWIDSSEAPSFSQIRSAKMELCTGTDLAQECVATLNPSFNPSIMKFTTTLPKVVQKDGKIWFLKFTTDSNTYSWSTRFTVTGTGGGTFDQNGTMIAPPTSANATNATTSTSTAPTSTSTSTPTNGPSFKSLDPESKDKVTNQGVARDSAASLLQGPATPVILGFTLALSLTQL
ncbi:MAG: hypothetical protein DHS80DRAFT_23762 [Piptocephalis tieghemiana]|nr:MAG: hypothetical protein DHS80DRAFT_23762 [Piptocephalis tieghemiana]